MWSNFCCCRELRVLNSDVTWRKQRQLNEWKIPLFLSSCYRVRRTDEWKGADVFGFISARCWWTSTQTPTNNKLVLRVQHWKIVVPREINADTHSHTHSYYCEFAECVDHSHAAAAAAATTTIRATNCHRRTHHFQGPDHIVMILWKHGPWFGYYYL